MLGARMIAHVPHSRDASPQLRDARIAHAKAANPPTLLPRFAEELRRAPVAGGGRGIFDVGFLIFDYL